MHTLRKGDKQRAYRRGQSFGEVTESGSALCDCKYAWRMCVRAQHVQYFMVSLTGIEWPNRQQRTVPPRRTASGSRAGAGAGDGWVVS